MQRRKVEDYMKTIYRLSQQGSVHGEGLAKALEVSRPTVCVSLKTLEKEGYLTRRSDHAVCLTEKGLSVALEVSERHSSLFQLLTNLGVNPETAAKDACGMEHIISRDSYCALIALARHTQHDRAMLVD